MTQGEETGRSWTRQDTLTLVSLLLLSLLVRLPHLLFPYVINPDAINYVKAGQLIAAGDVWSGLKITHLSVYPILIALVYPLFGDWVTAARSLPIAFGILAVLPYYLLSREVLGRHRAWIPALFFALCPTIVTTSTDVIREPIYWFVAAILLWVLVRAMDQVGWRSYLLAGGLALLGMTVRLDAAVLVLGASLFVVCLGWRRGSLRAHVRNALVLALPTVLAGLTAMVLLSAPLKRHGYFEFSSYPKQLKAALFGTVAVEKEVARVTTASSNPRVGRFFSMAWENRHALWAFNLTQHWVKATHLLLFLLMCWGLTRAPFRDHPPWLLCGILMVIWLLMAYLRLSGAFGISKRHLIPLVMVGYLFGSLGFLRAKEWCGRTWPAAPSRAIYAALVALILLTTLPSTLKPGRLDKLARRDAGEWIRSLGIADPLVVAESPHVSFYAGGRPLPFRKLLQASPEKEVFLVLPRKGGEAFATERLFALTSRGWKVVDVRDFQRGEEALAVHRLSPPAETPRAP